jgi:hypothetical protein
MSTGPGTLRWAKVEYQPNLQHPTKPVALGVVVEELRKDKRVLIIIGREPRGPVSGLELEHAWGPFRDVVAQWVETFAKSHRECLELVKPDEYALDELAKRWTGNVYLQAPVTKSSRLTLDDFAQRRFREFVYPSVVAPHRLRPWMQNRLQLQCTA